MPKLRVAAVGAGYFSQFHLQGWRHMAHEGLIDFVALADRDQARAQASRFGNARVFGDVAPMLDAARPDLLDIITPPITHAAVVRTAIERGIPMICQKPFATSYAEALELTELAEKAQVPLIVHENFRWQPWYREIRRFIDAGRLGAPHAISFRLRPGDGQGPRAYLDRQPYFQTMPRLLVMETAIHWIDTFRYLFGEVSAVTARLRRINPVIAGEDAGLIIFEFANGTSGLFDGNRCNDHAAINPRRTMGEAWVDGANGVLRLDGDAHLYFKPHHGEETPLDYDSGPDDSFGGGAPERLQRHVVAHLTQNAPIENRARDYLENLKVQEAVYCSHHEGRRIELARFHPSEHTIRATFAQTVA